MEAKNFAPSDLRASSLTVAEYQAKWGDSIETALTRRIDPDCPLAAPLLYVLSNKGKRLRPLMVLATTEAVGGDPENALGAAVAVEYLHTCSLILDDLPCMDNADMRRGAPTPHRVFDEATALLTALLLLNEAYDICARLSASATDAVTAVTRCIGQRGMISGQARDLAGDGIDAETMRLKTGSLFRLSVELGLALGAPTAEQALAMRHYADAFGIAFQLCDDITDGDRIDRGQADAFAAIESHCSIAVGKARQLRACNTAHVLAGMAEVLSGMATRRRTP